MYHPNNRLSDKYVSYIYQGTPIFLPGARLFPWRGLCLINVESNAAHCRIADVITAVYPTPDYCTHSRDPDREGTLKPSKTQVSVGTTIVISSRRPTTLLSIFFAKQLPIMEQRQQIE